MARYIFITGGVVSSLGKGLASAALGALLQARGYTRAAAQARPLSQRRSGDDEPLSARRGLRHRRRRRDRSRPWPLRALHRPPRHRSRTISPPAGSIRTSSPRSGAAIISARPSRSFRMSPTPSRSSSLDGNEGIDFVLVEIGGTVGDIEGLPFFEAIRQLGNELPRGHCDLYASDASAVHSQRRRTEDQADPAFGQGAALDRHPAATSCSAAPIAKSRARSAARSGCSAMCAKAP